MPRREGSIRCRREMRMRIPWRRSLASTRTALNLGTNWHFATIKSREITRNGGRLFLRPRLINGSDCRSIESRLEINCAKWRKMRVIEGWHIFLQRWQNITIDWVETMAERKTHISQNVLWKKYSQRFILFYTVFFPKHTGEKTNFLAINKNSYWIKNSQNYVFFFTAIASTLYSYK